MTKLEKIETLWRTLRLFWGFSKSLLGFSHPPPDLRGFGEGFCEIFLKGRRGVFGKILDKTSFQKGAKPPK